ncbi:MAG: hypothetical protein D6725_08985 [Planctomycetota bacterium]|nr:MAG: hypothetical protein D6725_08985 [Planctomycetota bacterium]
MSDQNVTVNRTLVGVLALACLGGAAALAFSGHGGQSVRLWQAGLIRVGLVLAALWIALPTKDRPAAWANISKRTLVVALIGLLALLRLPLRIVLPIVFGAALCGWLLRPRPRRRHAPPSARSASPTRHSSDN